MKRWIGIAAQALFALAVLAAYAWLIAIVARFLIGVPGDDLR